ncbi:glycoside hydrolase family 3 protein [Spirosoma rhododendri]|uniref:beta-glucosidase n=2 Tax=Spirosoma rhododendri TaxID=2728024 RepID=A0A7L5E102_9BACT|nr:glycoside hydrolase family 3 protein [Spirosoma rhododendri]
MSAYLPKSGPLLVACLLAASPAFTQTPIQPALGHRSIRLLTQNGLSFKDLNKNGKLDAYEDWRLPVPTRVQNLLGQMTLDEKVGLMLISTTRMAGDNSLRGGDGKTEITDGFNEEDLVQPNNMFTRKPLPVPIMSAVGTTKGVTQYHLRHFILRANPPAAVIASWTNNLQTLCETSRLGIPAMVASNPRNHVTIDAAVGLSVGKTAFSTWPGELGLAAMRDLKLTRAFADIARQEWAAVGLRKGYMYMADLATEPRWQRIEGTFGEDADLAADMVREIVLGFQGTKLGSTSVAMTTKHFPGGGPQLNGLDSHFDWGKFAHYPGGLFAYHLKPFKAAIAAGTSAIMPYYSAPKAGPAGEFEEVGFSYNKAIIQDLLRKQLGFKGIVNSDTGPIEMMPWGVENLTIPQRYQKALDAGVDLFSGTADPTILLDVVKQGLVPETRIDESVGRLLAEKFALGLFENPYVDVDRARTLVGNATFQQKADLAQRKSIVLLRNTANLLPLAPKTKVYFETYYDNGRSASPVTVYKPTKATNLELVGTKEEADVVVLWLIPTTGGLFASADKPIDLTLSKNKIDLKHVSTLMGSKPTVLAINFSSPWVLSEIEGDAKTVLATFGTTPDALLDIVGGTYKPTGKLPFTIPVSQQAVADNKSDVPGMQEPKGYALFPFGAGLTYGLVRAAK